MLSVRREGRSLPLSGQNLRKHFFEFGDEVRFVLAGVSAREEPVAGPVVEKLPGLLFAPRINEGRRERGSALDPI